MLGMLILAIVCYFLGTVITLAGIGLGMECEKRDREREDAVELRRAAAAGLQSIDAPMEQSQGQKSTSS